MVGECNSPYKHLDFIEIATIGNSQDFGELANQHGWCACFWIKHSCGVGGGYTAGTSYISDMSAVTVASEGVHLILVTYETQDRTQVRLIGQEDYRLVVLKQ